MTNIRYVHKCLLGIRHIFFRWMDLKSHEREEISVEKEISSSPVFCTEESISTFREISYMSNIWLSSVGRHALSCPGTSNGPWKVIQDMLWNQLIWFFSFCKFEFGVLGTWRKKVKIGILSFGFFELEKKSWNCNRECLSTLCQLLYLEAWKQFTCLLQNHLCNSWKNLFIIKKTPRQFLEECCF